MPRLLWKVQWDGIFQAISNQITCVSKNFIIQLQENFVYLFIYFILVPFPIKISNKNIRSLHKNLTKNESSKNFQHGWHYEFLVYGVWNQLTWQSFLVPVNSLDYNNRYCVKVLRSFIMVHSSVMCFKKMQNLTLR